MEPQSHLVEERSPATAIIPDFHRRLLLDVGLDSAEPSGIVFVLLFWLATVVANVAIIAGRRESSPRES